MHGAESLAAPFSDRSSRDARPDSLLRCPYPRSILRVDGGDGSAQSHPAALVMPTTLPHEALRIQTLSLSACPTARVPFLSCDEVHGHFLARCVPRA